MLCCKPRNLRPTNPSRTVIAAAGASCLVSGRWLLPLCQKSPHAPATSQAPLAEPGDDGQISV